MPRELQNSQYPFPIYQQHSNPSDKVPQGHCQEMLNAGTSLLGS